MTPATVAPTAKPSTPYANAFVLPGRNCRPRNAARLFATRNGSVSATTTFSLPVIACVLTRARKEPKVPMATAVPNPSLPRTPRRSSPAAQKAPANDVSGGAARASTPARPTVAAATRQPTKPPTANRAAAIATLGPVFDCMSAVIRFSARTSPRRPSNSCRLNSVARYLESGRSVARSGLSPEP
jgi:hypothetical protein